MQSTPKRFVGCGGQGRQDTRKLLAHQHLHPDLILHDSILAVTG